MVLLRPPVVSMNLSARGYRPFFIWLACFYGVWLMIIALGDHWRALAEHWQIAVGMAFGSFVAGSTPMGGGTIGFPVLVLILGQSAEIGRNFGFAVQSIGMTSAAILILTLRQPIPVRLVGISLGVSALVTPLSTLWLVPVIKALWIKLLFAVVWMSFGIVHLLRLRQLVSFHGRGLDRPRLDWIFGVATGIFGGILASITGVGIDMLLYMVLVLVYRTDLRIAIPASVIVMAGTSLIGVGTHALRGDLDPEVFYNWLAAAPVVILGAPFGVVMVRIVPRRPLLIFVSLLCVLQFVWTLHSEAVSVPVWAAASLGVLAFLAFFGFLYRQGERIAADRFVGETQLGDVRLTAAAPPGRASNRSSPPGPGSPSPPLPKAPTSGHIPAARKRRDRGPN